LEVEVLPQQEVQVVLVPLVWLLFPQVWLVLVPPMMVEGVVLPQIQ
jgi:hypothetical protein